MSRLHSSLLPFAGVFTLLLAGCNPRAVNTLMVEGPASLEENQSGDFFATVNEDARPPVSYSWDFGDGKTADGTEVSHAFTEAGDYDIIVTASNRDGRYSVSDTTRVMVVLPPVPAQALAILPSSTSVDTGTPVEFSANVRGDAPLSYNWSFGDGASSSSPRPQHTYMTEGDYAVSLELSNAYGRDVRTATITVTQTEPSYCADIVEMSAVPFARNSSILSGDARDILEDHLEILGECLNLNVRVEGLASPLERPGQELSEDRARAVMDYYVSNGIGVARVTMRGLGSATGTSKKSGADMFQRADSIILR